LYEGQQHRLRPNIQYALYEHGIVPRGPHDAKQPARYSPPAAEAAARQFLPASVLIEQNPSKPDFPNISAAIGLQKVLQIPSCRRPPGVRF